MKQREVRSLAPSCNFDKDDGEASDEDALVMDQLAQPGKEDKESNRRSREYKAGLLDIDGDDGILTVTAALALAADVDSGHGEY